MKYLDASSLELIAAAAFLGNGCRLGILVCGPDQMAGPKHRAGVIFGVPPRNEAGLAPRSFTPAHDSGDDKRCAINSHYDAPDAANSPSCVYWRYHENKNMIDVSK